MSIKCPTITSQEIERVADVRTLARLMHASYMSGLDKIVIPERVSILRDNPFSAFETMPAFSEEFELFIAKIGCVVPNGGVNERSVQAIVIAFCTRSGTPIALLDGNALTELKCAAISAMVTDICASSTAKVHSVIGSGIQAAVQISAVATVRKIEEIRVYSRNQSRLNHFIHSIQPRNPAVKIVQCTSAEQAVAGADIVSTATTSITPVISASTMTKGPLHINCVGNHTVESREVPIDVLKESFVIVEDFPTALREAGPSHQHAATVKQLVRGEAVPEPGQKTIFASTGHAHLDLIATTYLLNALGLLEDQLTRAIESA